MINLSLKQLRYFDALAQEHHFGRAAEVCAISQPALSMQIKDMEEALGVVLIDRSARQPQLTKFGEIAAIRVAEILRSVDELADLARASEDKMVGELRLGAISTIAPYVLPSLIRALATTHPSLDVYAKETITANLIDDLTHGRLDAALVALPVSEPSLVEVPLFTETFWFVCPSDFDVSQAPSARELRSMRLLLLQEGHCFRDQALSFCDLNTAKPKEILDASSLATLVQMVAAGIGVTLIPNMSVAVETKSAAVKLHRFEAPEPTRTIGMIWRKSNPISGQLQQIADIVKALAEDANTAAGAI